MFICFPLAKTSGKGNELKLPRLAIEFLDTAIDEGMRRPDEGLDLDGFLTGILGG